MRRKGLEVVVPQITSEEVKKMKPKDVVNLNSTYFERARGDMPKVGDLKPWQPRVSFWVDMWQSWVGGWEGLQFL